MSKLNIKIFLILIILVTTKTLCTAQTTLSLATGSKEGVYYSLGKTFKTIIEKNNPDIEIIILSTEGSIENAKLINSNSADIAFIQSDIAYYLYNGERMFKFPSQKISGIISLYTEAIQIIARKELNIEKISDLKEKIIAVGNKNSGTEFNSSAILSAAGIEYKDINEQFLSFTEAKNSLLNGKIDAAFITAGIPTPAITNMTDNINIISIGLDTVTKLRKSYPFFIGTKVPAKSYQGQNHDIFTVGIRALLVANSNLKSNIVERITKTIFNESVFLKEHYAMISDFNLKNALKDMTVPLHKGAKKYYKNERLIKKEFKDYLKTIFQIIIIFIFLILLFKYHYYIRNYIRKNLYVKFFILLLVLFIVGTTGTYLFERRVNENFISIPRTLWVTIVYLISGFEGAGPITTGGKISSIIIFLGSIAILGSVAGKFASIFINKGEKKMPKNIRKHIAICNWNDKGDKIIKELHHPDAEPHTEIIVLTNKVVNEEELRKSKRYENVYFIKGDPVIHETLKTSRIHLAKSVIILANPKNNNPDPESALICLAIKKLADKNEKPHIIVEIMNPQNREHLLDAGADEVVSAGFYRTGIMLQSALYHNLSDIYHELLIYSKDGNEVYIIPEDKLPKSIIGKTFKEASEIINNNRDAKNPAILVGVRRNKKVILNPKNEGTKEKKFDKFQKGDSLIVMSYRLPDLLNIK